MSDTANHAAASESKDPCAEFGATQRFAVLWFVGALVLGTCLTYVLSRIDHQMYQQNAEVLDFEAYRENREAATSIASEALDPRSRGEWSQASGMIPPKSSK